MNMRKIIAVLAAMLLLCAAIPMAAISVSAAALVDYDFEDGSLGSWKYDTTNDTLEVVDGAMKWTTVSWKNTYLNFKATANTDYKLTIRAKADVNATVDIKFLNGSWGTSGIEKTTATFGTDWIEHTYIFNSLEYGGLVLLFQSHKATTIYIDSVKIEEYVAPKDPVFPENAIYTETFENANLNGWTSNCSVVSTAGLAATNAEGGNYCLEFISPNYSYTNYKMTNLEKNTDYVVTFSILSATKGYPINARVRDSAGDLGYVQYTPSITAWETHSYLFNSGNNTSANLRFQAGWATGTYYIDNISVAPIDLSAIANDGHIMNGNFESGNNLGWNTSANTTIVADPTGAGQGYVIKTFEPGSSTDMFTQEFKNLVAGKTYTLSFKVYGYGSATNNVFYVRIPKDATFSNATGIATSDSGKTYVVRYNMNSGTKKWYTVTVDFVPASSSALIQFQNYRTDQGFYYFDDITLSHVYGEGVVTAPDCENGGYTTYTCACGATYKDNYTDAKGHNYVDGVCSVCGAEDPNYEPPHTCNVVEQERVDADCVNDGYIKYACDCGLGEYTETIKAKGHTAGAAADCTNAQTCTVCGAELTAALGHAYTETSRVAATCGANGSVTYTCDNCGDSYTDTIPATGEHTYFDACSAICEVCGYEREVSHNVIHVEAKASTCTSMGNIEFWYCDVCGAAWLDAECTLNTNMMAVKLPALEAVASIGDALYASLADALADAANGEIVLLADIELAAPITVAAGQTVTLDLNGHTVTYNSTTQGEAMITNYGTLTINDSEGNGVINYNYTGAADPSYGNGNYTISNSGNLTVNGGYITIANLRQHAKYPIDNNSTTGDAELVINGGHLYNYNTSAIRMFCNSTVYKNSVTINGGLIEGYCAIWVQNPGKNTVNAQLTIAGGEIKSTASAYVNGTSKLEDVSSAIYCTINGEGGAWDESSLISITGGVINENVYLADSAPSNLNVEGEAEFNGYVELPVPPCEHEYDNACDVDCNLCYETREVSHNIVHVAAVAPTCGAEGNIEYWYCDVCGMAWLDEACTLNTNLRAVKLPMAEHTYDHDFDADCNVCGDKREVVNPMVGGGTSAMEMDGGLGGVAAMYTANVQNLGIKDGTTNVADYTNATMNGHKLLRMGVVASNGKSTVEIPCVYLMELDENSAAFAARVINIPEAGHGVEITFQSYFVVEIDGVETTVYGDVQYGTYNAIIG